MILILIHLSLNLVTKLKMNFIFLFLFIASVANLIIFTLVILHFLYIMLVSSTLIETTSHAKFLPQKLGQKMLHMIFKEGNQLMKIKPIPIYQEKR